MNIEMQKSELSKRQNSLRSEVSDIQEEVVVLLALLRKAEGEIGEIQAKLDEIEEQETISLSYAC